MEHTVGLFANIPEQVLRKSAVVHAYNVGVPTPSSVRFDPAVRERLNAFVRAHPGLTFSSATNLLVDEGLRQADHPLIGFVDGPGGRQSRLFGGPDVDVVIAALVATRDAHPDLSVDGVLERVAAEFALPLSAIRAAVEYWAAFPDDVDAHMARRRDTEAQARARAARVETLLG
jgi:hypothetical protein